MDHSADHQAERVHIDMALLHFNTALGVTAAHAARTGGLNALVVDHARQAVNTAMHRRDRRDLLWKTARRAAFSGGEVDEILPHEDRSVSSPASRVARTPRGRYRPRQS